MKSKGNYPYKGLAPFTSNDFKYFFGRKAEIKFVLEQIVKNKFCAVIGFSGTGKSSLVRAGVIPSLNLGLIPGAEEGWQVASFRPGNNPLEGLSKALMKTEWGKDYAKDWKKDLNVASVQLFEILEQDDRNLRDLFYYKPLPDKVRLLVLVDQFEEIFDNVKGFKSTQGFINTLIDVAKNEKLKVHVIVTMRVEHLAKLIHFDDLPETFSRSIYFVPRISSNSLKDAIQKPARMFGKRFSAELLDILLKRTLQLQTQRKGTGEQDEDDTLPLLQHFLMRLWGEFSDEKAFTIQHYRQLGPLENVLNKHLDDIYYFKLTPDQRGLTKFLFKTISKKGEKSSLKSVERNPKKLKEIIGLFVALYPNSRIKNIEKEFIQIINIFSAPEVNILQTRPEAVQKLTGNSEIDIMHESVFRNWEICWKWIEEEIEKVDKLTELLSYENKKAENWKVKEFLKEQLYFTNEAWVSSKGRNNEKVKLAFRWIEELNFKHAITKGGTYDLYKIINGNVNSPETPLFLEKKTVLDGSFKKELYYALCPEQALVIEKSEQKIPDDNEQHKKRWKDNNIDINLIKSEEKQWSIPHYAAQAGNKEYLSLLSNHFGNDVLIMNSSPNAYVFGSAVYGGDLETIKFIYNELVSNPDLLKLGNSTKDIDLVEDILINEHESHRTNIHFAALMGHLEVLKWYSSIGIDLSMPNYTKRGTPILSAATLDRVEVIKYLLEEGVKQDIESEFGLVPLHVACLSKSLSSINLLLENAEDNGQLELLLNAKDCEKYTPLMYAIQDVPKELEEPEENRNIYKLEIAKKLLSYKEIEIDSQNSSGWTALHLAVYDNDFTIVELLLKNGAKPEIGNQQENTALHLVARQKDAAILQLILNKSNEFIESKNLFDLTPAQEAFEWSNYHNLEILIQAGCRFDPPLWHYYDNISLEGGKIENEKVRSILEQTLLDHSNSQWEIAPLFLTAGEWKIATTEEAIDILLRLHEHLSTPIFWEVEKVVSLRSYSLPFYEEATLYEARAIDKENQEKSIVFIAHPEGVNCLDGNSQVIHQLNKQLPIKLNDENVLSYLRFFCSVVHGDEGPFKVINSLDQIHWLNIEEKNQTKAFLEFLIETYTSTLEKDQKGTWSVRLLINYSNAIFLADFRIKANGMLEMIEDFPVLADLSVKVEVFELGSRTYRIISPENGEEQFERLSILEAAAYGFLKVMQWMKQNDEEFDINKAVTSQNADESTENEGKTALMLAVEKGHKKVVKWLLEQEGLNLDLKDHSGETALMKAQKSKNKKLVKLLLESGAKK